MVAHAVSKELQHEFILELLAVLSSLTTSDERGLRLATLSWLTYRKFFHQQVIALDWRFRHLKAIYPPPLPPVILLTRERSVAFLDMLYHCMHAVNLEGLSGPMLDVTRYFVPSWEVINFFGDEQRLEALWNLLSRIEYRDTRTTYAATVKRAYLRIVCILLMLREWDSIPRFIRTPELRDSNLPFLDMPKHRPFSTAQTCGIDFE